VIIGGRYSRSTEFNIKPKCKPMQWSWKSKKTWIKLESNKEKPPRVARNIYLKY